MCTLLLFPVLLALLLTTANSFLPPTSFPLKFNKQVNKQVKKLNSMSNLPTFVEEINKYPQGMEFSLEEKEDKETMSTTFYLTPPLSVTFGPTTGPPPLSTSGAMKILNETPPNHEVENSAVLEFEFSVTRTFVSGFDTRLSSDDVGTFQTKRTSKMGEFKFDVKRVYVGNVERIG
eukprot:CAMPEP_0118657282 /NCGR_PEP_ID=MMETSP0785-20121206/13937_1 /TAXON_ID=91992 /ORGANISM="Bolidomonas pacifica, Strain CCMP 1866" /LENGTH=175 /DNA_ID=CAMNT_0006550193 /DNA_START=34 /DNA_END=558 /DNA_ORIENTATION=+